jgi:hypothetical protein
MFKAWWDIVILAVETQQLMWLRFMQLATRGPTASPDSQRMVTEKFAVAAPAAADLSLYGRSRNTPQPS